MATAYADGDDLLKLLSPAFWMTHVITKRDKKRGANSSSVEGSQFRVILTVALNLGVVQSEIILIPHELFCDVKVELVVCVRI